MTQTREQALEAAGREIVRSYERIGGPLYTDPAVAAMRRALAMPPDADAFKPKAGEDVRIHSMGKRLRLTAIAAGDDAANRHMAKHPDDAVIACFGGLVLMAGRYDNGAP